MIQLNETNVEDNEYNKRINFNGLDDSQAPVAKYMTQAEQKYYGKTAEGEEKSEQLRFWLGFSTACVLFHQFQLMRDATTLWVTSLYAREEAAISSNSLSDLCTSNSVSVSLLESIIAGKRHCGIFIEILLSEIDGQSATTSQNYASLILQLWIQDYLQDLKVVWLNKTDTVKNRYLAYHMIPPEKPDIVYLLAEPTAQGVFSYKKFNMRIIYMQNAAAADRGPQNIPQPYEALTQTVNGLIFDCFVDQDVVSAPSDLYHSLTFENLNCTNKVGGFYRRGDVNVFHISTPFEGTKASKPLYPNKQMLAWKLTSDDSFMRDYNSSKLGARTNIQDFLHGNLTKNVQDNTDTNKDKDQTELKQFIAMRSYSDPTKAFITPMMHYLCDAFMRIIFDNNYDPQVLNIDVIGELAGSAINTG
ncbi:MAG: hypothetical protein EZS28_025134 [Streblomastix strix]|uniref:Uncharacterized protein n=1 Tax=Streblomastix strix TaxID=222440 RepID=A0A5J4V9U7_9EUKA|nr:MAG: hypothetical protein EZS28_025134 [Streblomastix strix]